MNMATNSKIVARPLPANAMPGLAPGIGVVPLPEARSAKRERGEGASGATGGKFLYGRATTLVGGPGFKPGG